MKKILSRFYVLFLLLSAALLFNLSSCHSTTPSALSERSDDEFIAAATSFIHDHVFMTQPNNFKTLYEQLLIPDNTLFNKEMYIRSEKFRIFLLNTEDPEFMKNRTFHVDNTVVKRTDASVTVEIDTSFPISKDTTSQCRYFITFVSYDEHLCIKDLYSDDMVSQSLNKTPDHKGLPYTDGTLPADTPPEEIRKQQDAFLLQGLSIHTRTIDTSWPKELQ